MRRLSPTLSNPYLDVFLHLMQVAIVMAYLRVFLKRLPTPFGKREFEDETIIVATSALLVDWKRVKRLVDEFA